MTEHPSLKIEKSASANIQEINGQIKTLRETLQKIQGDSSRLTEEFQTLDAVTLLAQLQDSLQQFMARYGAKIDLLASVAEQESVLIVKLSKAVDALL